MKCKMVNHHIIKLIHSVYEAICTIYRKLHLFLITLGHLPFVNFIRNIVFWFSSTINNVFYRRHFGIPALFSAAHALRSTAHRLQNPGNFSYSPLIDDSGTLMDNL